MKAGANADIGALNSAEQTERGAAWWFVWTVWAVMLGAALFYVASYGSPLPFVDDWDFIPSVTGDRTDTLSWLWAQNNQQRHLVTRSVLTSLLRLGGGDFRIPLFFNALALGAVSWGMIRVAATIRGSVSYTDAFFPLLMLNWGLRNYLVLASDGVFHVLPTLLASLLLLIVVRRGTDLGMLSGLTAGLLLIALALTCAAGLLYVPALGLWLAGSGLHRFGSGSPRAKRDGTMLLISAGLAWAIVPVYFIGFRANDYGLAAATSIWDKLRMSLGFLASGLGGQGPWAAIGLGVVVLLAISLGVLIDAIRRRHSRDRSQAWGMLAYFVAICGLALAIGWGREAMGVAHLLRYGALALPIPCLVYFASGLARPHALGSVMRALLFVAAAMAAGFNTAGGIEFGREHAARMAAFEKDIRSGMPPYRIIARYKDEMLYWGTHEDFAGYLRMAQRAGLEPFHSMVQDPEFVSVPLPVTPAATVRADWSGTTARGFGRGSYLSYSAPRPMFVAGIRILCTHSHAENAYVEVVLDEGSGSAFAPAGRRLLWAWPGSLPIGGPIGGPARPFVIYVGATIRGFRLYPHNEPFEMSIERIDLLVPEDGRGPLTVQPATAGLQRGARTPGP